MLENGWNYCYNLEWWLSDWINWNDLKAQLPSKWACININLREQWRLSQQMVLNNNKSSLNGIGMLLKNTFSYKMSISLHPKQELFLTIQRQNLTSKSHKRLDSSVLIFLISFTRWQPENNPHLCFHRMSSVWLYFETNKRC